MQIPERSDVERENNDLLNLLRRNKIPIGIEEFINNKESPSTHNVFKVASPIRLAKVQDIPQLIDVNNSVYDGYYPYRDMLDVEYVKEFAQDTKNGFISVYDTEDKKTIGGFFLLGVDHGQRKGFFRGLMVSPEHQHKLQLKSRVMETIYQGYKQYYQHVEMWYGETRTAHEKGQKWMEESGSRPCAFFPTKDIFTRDRIRESDVLEVVYTRSALSEFRNSNPKILSYYKPLYMHISECFHLPIVQTISQNNNDLDCFKSNLQGIDLDCSITKEPDQYGNYSYIFQTSNGSSMKFWVNKSISTAERTEFNVTSARELAILLQFLKSFFIKKQLEYFEIYVPADNVDYQLAFKNFGFSCFGYVPAWKWHADKLNDCFVFGLYRTPINWYKTTLSQNYNSLLSVLRPYLNVF